MTPALLAVAAFALGATTSAAACYAVLDWALARVECRQEQRRPRR